MKTSELIGPALDWAVAKCMGREDPIYWFAPEPGDKDWEEGADYSKLFYISGPERQGPYSPSTNWAQGGPILNLKGISKPIDIFHIQQEPPVFEAEIQIEPCKRVRGRGPSQLIAAMRCFVASKLGDEIELPKELI